jgi:hypothetical protein
MRLIVTVINDIKSRDIDISTRKQEPAHVAERSERCIMRFIEVPRARLEYTIIGIPCRWTPPVSR